MEDGNENEDVNEGDNEIRMSEGKDDEEDQKEEDNHEDVNFNTSINV